MDKVSVSVFNVAASELCIDTDDGAQVYVRVADLLKAGMSVEISFLNVQMVTSAFLNTVIGQLY